MPPRRLLNYVHHVLTESLAYAEDEDREAFHAQMEWPEVVAVEAESAQDRSARHAAALIGTSNVEEMVMRAWEARQRAAAAEPDQTPGDEVTA